MKKVTITLTSLVIAVVISIVSEPIYAGNAKVGTTGAQFLKIVPAARPSAMGGTYGALGDDVQSIVVNPAGLSNITNKEITATQVSWFQGISYQYIAVGLPTGIGNIGIGINSVSIGGIERRTGATDEPIDTFGASDSAISISYAKKVGEKLGVGGSIKSISSKIDNQSAGGLGIDIGVISSLGEKASIGIAVQNIGSGIKYISQTDPLPMNIKIGIGYKVNESLIAGLDINQPNDNNLNVSVGGEYGLKIGEQMSLPVRLGYRTGLDVGGLSAGVGFSFSSFGIDITFAPYGDLGNTLRIGLKYKF